MRISVLGNAGGGKTTLARRLAREHDLPYHEADAFLWRPGYKLAPEADYAARHAEILAQDAWVLDGLGRFDSLETRMGRSQLVTSVNVV
jgi:adenylate kinase family enzyme